MLNVVLSLCVFIECWHMFYYGIFFEKFARIHKVIDWTMQYKSMIRNFMQFANMYADTEHLELKSTISDGEKSILEILNHVESMGGMNASTKMMELLNPKQVYLFLAHQVAEIIYWLCIMFMLITLPLVGKILIIIVLVLSVLESKFNKKHDVGIHIFDSLMCIGIYIMISSMF